MGVLKEVITTYIEEDGKIKITEAPLVRCKECKHYKFRKDEYIGAYMACTYVIGGTVARYQDDYCSRGERRTDEGITE